MPSNKKKNRKHNFKNNDSTIKIYEIDVLLDDDEILAFKIFCDDLFEAHNKKFIDCDLNGKSNDEKIDLLKQRYVFYHNYFPKCISLDDTLAIAKNNYLNMSIKILRDVAKNHNIEHELSISITNECLMPIDHILLKHAKHKFQYCDEMEHLQKLHSGLVLYDIDLDLIQPKQIINNYHNYDAIKLIFLCQSKLIKKKYQRDKIISYFDNFDTFFPKKFCLDLQKCFLDSISNASNTQSQ
jgi:hypothetical protein